MDNFKRVQRPAARPGIDGFSYRSVVRPQAISRGADRPPIAAGDFAAAPRPASAPASVATAAAASASAPAVAPIPAPVSRARLSPVQSKPMPASPKSQPLQPSPAPHRTAPVALPNLDLNLDDAPARPTNRLTAGRRFRKWLLRGGIMTAVVMVAVGGLLLNQAYAKMHRVFKGTANHAVALQSNVDPALLKGEGDGRVNVLLLGIGGAGHDGADLTDTIMVASIDPVNKTTTLLSVPRDLWVAMPNNFMGANQKINAAYEAGKYKYLGKTDASNDNAQAVQAGFAAADQTISGVLGIPIHYNMLVNFQAFKQGVDTVGGITVDVPEQLYDPTMAWENNHNPVLAAKGVQQMDGATALRYVRSRETSSDFARSERQRLVFMALKEKSLSLGTLSNPLKISQLMDAFGNNMMTDFSLSDAVRFYDLTKGIKNEDISSLDLVTAPNTLVGTANMNGISIDQPKAGLNNYADIQKFVRSKLRDGYLVKENAQLLVLNGTAKSGVATAKAADLASYGYNVAKVDNAPSHYSKTVVVDLTNGADKYTRHYLENRYGVTAVTQLPDAAIQPGTANFVVILGDDQE